ncbi:MAG: hypothetical protein FWD54_03315 [Endomicrobia bacterium]|nr:hypothetical protein [Endomicrobiia bacterium]
MKFYAVLAFFFFFCSAIVSAENYSFPAESVESTIITANAGRINITTSYKAKTISVSFKQGVPPSTKRNIRINNRKQLEIYLDGDDFDENSTVDIVLPKEHRLQISSLTADIKISNLSGSISLDASAGTVNIKNFNGNLGISSVSAQIDAEGEFKMIDLESVSAFIWFSLKKLPPDHDYTVSGAGNIRFILGKGVNEDNLNIKKNEFYGNLEITDGR